MGEPSPANEGNPYGGVADIVVYPLTPTAFVHHGALDASGHAVVQWQVRALPGGHLPGLQMLVFLPGQPGRNVTSAAFYCTAE